MAQVILGATASSFDFGSQLSINLGYGLGGMIGAFMAGGVTGAHMNPAVTLAMALRGRLNWLKVRTTFREEGKMEEEEGELYQDWSRSCANLLFLFIAWQVIPYWFAQLLGAFLSAAMIYWVYYGE